MPTYNGKKGNDTITGSSRNDWMSGREGNDTLYGLGGDDELHGWYGNDQLFGGAGNDRLLGEFDDDYLDGGDGNDTLNGGAGADILIGGSGNNNLYGGDGNDTITGGSGMDEIAGNAGADVVTGGIGPDRFFFNTIAEAVPGDFITDFEAGTDVLWGGLNWDANAALAGKQKWDYVGSDPTGAATAGNGQATVSYADGNTTLRLYNADGDLSADFTLTVNGTVAPEDLQIITFLDGAGFSDPAIIYPGG
jgi:Ca2+-binding RTX toxin-like protein